MRHFILSVTLHNLLLSTIGLLLVSCSGNASSEPDDPDTWIDFEYDEARAYFYDNILPPDSFLHGEPIILDGKLNPTVINPEGVALSANQIDYVGKVLNGNFFEDDEMAVADCYEPRHGFVFYLNGSVVAHVSICFECNQIRSTPKHRATPTRFLKRVFEELEIPIAERDFR